MEVSLTTQGSDCTEEIKKEQGQKENNPAVGLNLGLFFAVGLTARRP